MALTKKDLSQIKGAVGEATKTLSSKQDLDSAIENLARKERISYIERDTAEIRKGLISRVELEDIWARLSLVEKKLGIVSGK